jgi:hypothetical protein
MKRSPPQPFFWVTNQSSMNVTLADLAINIKSFTSINLMDKKHHQYTMEQLVDSATSGSLFKKRDKIAIRSTPPKIEEEKTPMQQEATIPSRERSIYVINQKEYDELKIDDKENQDKMDEEYARENVELVDEK